MRLFINLDHVATVRQARRTDEPDPVRAAVLAELGGADGVTVHLRLDRRHVQDRDVELLLGTIRTPLNLELAAAGEMVERALGWQPAQATLVPENREEVTTEGGLDLGKDRRGAIADALGRLAERGVRTSLFIDPDPAVIDRAAELGPDAVELHTGEYANAPPDAGGGSARGGSARGTGSTARAAQLERLRDAADRARAAGLDVHAGHGLTYENVTPVARIVAIEELNIGHSVVSRAVLVGMERAVREMAETVRRARGGC